MVVQKEKPLWELEQAEPPKLHSEYPEFQKRKVVSLLRMNLEGSRFLGESYC
jgi:hypothetical protein